MPGILSVHIVTHSMCATPDIRRRTYVGTKKLKERLEERVGEKTAARQWAFAVLALTTHTVYLCSQYLDIYSHNHHLTSSTSDRMKVEHYPGL